MNDRGMVGSVGVMRVPTSKCRLKGLERGDSWAAAQMAVVASSVVSENPLMSAPMILDEYTKLLTILVG